VFDGFTFHMLRHTAASLMALAGMDPAAAAERLEHSDGGALFHKTYRHLYEGEKQIQAQRLDDFVRSVMDAEWTKDPHEDRDRPHREDPGNGRYWARNSEDDEPPIATEGDFVGLLQALVRSRSESPEGSSSTLFDSVDGQIRDNRAPESSPSAVEVAQLLRWVADLLERGWSA
jgi:hypothetical protein